MRFSRNSKYRSLSKGSRSTTLSVSLLFCLMLAGCGGIVPGPPPTVHSTQPAAGAADVPLNTAIAVTFSEEMDPNTITTGTFFLDRGATGTVSYAGLTATFTPSGPLAPSTTYTVTVTTGAKDLVGNSLEENHLWTFTTGTLSTTAPPADLSPPTVISTTPGPDEKDVSSNTAITVTFSEEMDPNTITTGTFFLDRGATGTVSYAGLTATFTPSGPLEFDRSYTATVTTGAKDLAGNPLEINQVWGFKTEKPPIR
ncbi:Ig-like domain-containing protein [Candidatus Manganitrophus noduliformans]|nr:Ig-like domain-containing protein [Candidatus Manganitrophus noduliformans]